MAPSLTRPGVVEAIADVAMIVGADLRFAAVNRAATALLAGPEEDLVGRELFFFVIPEDAARLQDALARSKRAPEGWVSLHLRLLSSGGEPLHTELRVAVLGVRQRSDGYLITAPHTADRSRAVLPRQGEFFSVLARHAAEALGIRHALIARLEGSPPSHASTLAVWSDGGAAPNISFPLAGTPCVEVLQRRITHYPDGVREAYPDHDLLRDLGAESCLATSILDSEHQPVGLLILLDDTPSPPSSELFSLAYLLALRAGEEMERERLAAEAKEAESRWLELARETRDGLFDIDLGTETAYLSPRCLQLLGHARSSRARYTPVSILTDCVHGDDRAVLDRELDRVRDGKDQIQCTLRLRRHGGDYRWFEVHARLSRDAAGEPARALGLISDVTAVQGRGRLLRQISEVARIAAWTYDIEEDRFTTLTDPVRAIGNPEEEAAALLRSPEQLLGPADASRARAAMLQARAEGRSWDYVYSRRLPAGTTVWRRTFAEVEMERGVAVRLHGAIQDITAIHELETRYLQAQKMEAIGLLAGGIAHDFNNLLTVIGTLRDLVTVSVPDQHPSQAELVEMGEMIRTASGLTRQLLALTRKQMVEPVSLSLNELITASGPLLTRLVGGSIDLQCSLGPGVWLVRADRSQLEQVLLNLIVNARDAMPAGGRLSIFTRNVVFSGPQPTVAGECPAGAFVELQVRDTGIGMARETAARAFEPFFTTKAADSGVGLGLSTCLGIVQQAGGYIAIESAPDLGTTFFIWLPPADRAADASPLG